MMETGVVTPPPIVGGVVPALHHDAAQVTELTVRDPPPLFFIWSCWAGVWAERETDGSVA